MLSCTLIRSFCINKHLTFCLPKDFRHQDDETVASRGSISMKTAILRQTDRSRFEVHSMSIRGGHLRSNQQSQGSKWYIKASHPGEAHRWVEAIGKSIEYFKQREKEGGGESDSSSVKRRRSLESVNAESGLRMAITPSMSSSSGSNGGQKVVWGKSGVSGRDRDQESIVGSISGSYAPTLAEPASPVFLSEEQLSKKGVSDNERERGDDDDDESSEDMEGESKVDPPHPNVELQGNAFIAQLEITNQLVESVLASGSSGVTQTHQALTESLQTIQSLFSTFLDMTRERDEWYSRQLKSERKRQRVWEESLAVVVREGEGLEKELRKRRGRGGSFLGGTQRQNEPKRRPSIIGTVSGTVQAVPPVPQKMDTSQGLPTAVPPATPPAIMKALPVARSSTTETLTSSVSVHRPTAITVSPSGSRLQQNETYEDDDHDTDEEDEFFDAIEMGNLPNLLVHEGLTSPLTVTSAALITPRASQVEISSDSGTVGPADLRSLSLSKNISLPKGVIFQPYTSYTSLRSKLSITEDDRPSTSLWSVLKHSIGKDLTRISFPVFFNEPTSMLQRMAEDMEFSECCAYSPCLDVVLPLRWF